MKKLIKRICNKGKLVAATAVGFLAAGVTNVQAQVDTTAIVGAFTDAATGVGAIAAVMLGVVAAGIAVKWILGFVIS